MRALLFCVTLIPWHMLPAQENNFKTAHAALVDELLKSGIKDEQVVDAIKSVKRHLFVSENLRNKAYENQPLPIGEGQTISQPLVVAHMTEALQLSKTDKVLEIGTGSGYQAAILSVIVDSVYTIEIKKKLADQAERRLQSLAYANIQTKCADGYFGWSEAAPFDAIIITCAVNHVPRPLLDQLKIGGRMVLPLGSTRYYQLLVRITKRADDSLIEYLAPVAFVPMTGMAEKK